jgi:hypothetical protein
MVTQVTAFVSHHWRVPPELLRVDVQKLHGGLESAVARARILHPEGDSAIPSQRQTLDFAAVNLARPFRRFRLTHPGERQCDGHVPGTPERACEERIGCRPSRGCRTSVCSCSWPRCDNGRSYEPHKRPRGSVEAWRISRTRVTMPSF